MRPNQLQINDLKNQFVRQSVADLEEIARNLAENDGENPSENLLGEISRRLHTVKGTAQTFNLPVSAELAHTLENLLVERQHSLLAFGIRLLAKSLGEKNFQIPVEFAQIGKFQSAPRRSFFKHNFQPEVYAKLSPNEKARLDSVFKDGKDLLIVEINFEMTSFAQSYKSFREKLNSVGEIIAALPNSDFKTDGQIGFQVIFATKENAAELIRESNAKIVYQMRQNFSGDLSGVLAQIAAHGESVAESLGKKCEFNVSAEQIEISAATLKLIFDALLHLVRNAIDHGIEQTGKININIAQMIDGLIITVSDDGQGVDTTQIRALISDSENLTDQQIVNLVFERGISTAEHLTEISGRGTGLDAVKNLIETAGGTISVKSGKSEGTKFTINLPLKTMRD